MPRERAENLHEEYRTLGLQMKTVVSCAVLSLEPSTWAMPIVRFYRGELSRSELMAATTDNDKQTEARCFLGYQRLLAGDKSAAREQFIQEKKGPSTFLNLTT